MSEIGILGAGGMAKEIVRYSSERIAFFALSGDFLPPAGTNSGDIPFINVEEPDERQKKLMIVSALGAPAIRRSMVESWPGDLYANVIAKSAEIFTEQTSSGLIVAPQAVITVNTEIGNHSIINVGATISHDCTLGEYVTVGPGAHIGGNVILGDGVFVGIGATVKNGISIAEGSVVGAGAVVVKDINVPNSVVVGNPAKTIQVREGWLSNV